MGNNIGSWTDLREYGIECLTGEADRYGMRLLCDLSEKGASLLSTYLGSNVVFTEGSNWNRMVGTEPSVASVMLPYEAVEPLARFIMFHIHGYRWAIYMPGNGTSGTSDEERISRYRELSDKDDSIRIYTNMGWSPSQPVVGDRNVHQFSGRAS